MMIPTAPSLPTYTHVTPTPAPTTTYGEAIASLAGQGQAIYDLAQSRRDIDRVLAVNDYLAAALSTTPIGAYVAIGALAKHATVAAVDYNRGLHRAHQIRRQVQSGLHFGRRLTSEGHAPGVAGYFALRRIAPAMESAGVRKYTRLLRASPFYLRRAAGGSENIARDPETGQPATRSQLLAKYGPGYQDRLSNEITAGLYARHGTNLAGFYPAPLAQYRRVA